jgi:hypothetical protein
VDDETKLPELDMKGEEGGEIKVKLETPRPGLLG